MGRLKTRKRDDPPGHLYGKIPDQIQKLFEERNIARNEKNWEKADLLRKTIEEQGFQVQDSKDATKLNKTWGQKDLLDFYRFQCLLLIIVRELRFSYF